MKYVYLRVLMRIESQQWIWWDAFWISDGVHLICFGLNLPYKEKRNLSQNEGKKRNLSVRLYSLSKYWIESRFNINGEVFLLILQSIRVNQYTYVVQCRSQFYAEYFFYSVSLGWVYLFLSRWEKCHWCVLRQFLMNFNTKCSMLCSEFFNLANERILFWRIRILNS